MALIKNKPYITYGLVIVNVIVYVVLEIMGDTESALFMLQHGAMYPTNVVDQGEWWRLFTSTFLHFGPRHLFNNMLVFVFLGGELEKMVGHIKYLFFYVICGIGASACSLGFMLITKDYAVAAGASGAIFGVIGGVLGIALVYRDDMAASQTAKRLLFYIALTVYLGVSSSAESVDNMAHLGGVLIGFVLGLGFGYVQRRNQKRIRF